MNKARYIKQFLVVVVVRAARVSSPKPSGHRWAIAAKRKTKIN